LNEKTHVSVCCYQGDAEQVRNLWSLYQQHTGSVTVFSPGNSAVNLGLPGEVDVWKGRVGYIGQDSLDRQREHLQHLLTTDAEWFFLNDSDSFCLSPRFDQRLYLDRDTLWANLVQEPRPHPSLYPKIASQPPYFFSRQACEAMRRVPAGKTIAHPVTPYIDWLMTALASEAKLKLRSFTDLETPCPESNRGQVFADPWDQLAYRIRHMNCRFMHPIKTPEQIRICQWAYAHREPNQYE